MFVGIDWASRAHELCVVGEEGEVVARLGFAHSERGISDALERLREYEQVGVERVMLQHLVHEDVEMVNVLGDVAARLG